jgi:hypothetical protein
MKNIVKTLGLLILLPACSFMETDYRYDRTQDFSDYRSFAWLNEDIAVRGKFKVDNERLDELIRSGIEMTLITKGFRKQNPQIADFHINYRAAIYTKTADQYHPQWFDINQPYRTSSTGYSNSLSANTKHPLSYENGTLVIDMIDNKTQKLVWRGILQTPVGLYNERNQQAERINEAVMTVLEAFPPGR